MQNRLKNRLGAAALATLLGATALVAAPAAQAAMPGTNSLATVLTAKSSFDKNGGNYDILTAAVLAVLKAKPMSPVKALTDGTVALTAFIPNDRAFEALVKQLTGKAPVSEKATFETVAGLGIDTVEQILEYHVVPGATILSGDALKANGKVLTTVLTGKTLKVKVRGMTITLGDYSTVRSPRVILSQVDINKGNLQVAHGINAPDCLSFSQSLGCSYRRLDNLQRGIL